MSDLPSFPIRRYSVAAGIAWTLIIAGSFSWFYRQQKTNFYEIAQAEARIAFQKDILYRKWVSKHGGVYVPITPETPPNPYLSRISDREITTPSGKKLTLINPAYMTRQVFELAEREESFVKGHITSINPIRPENSPDSWELTSLHAFEKGAKEVSSIQDVNGQQYMRLMRPFLVEQPCLKCHDSQGYKLGDIRGGISISVPMRIFSQHSNENLLVAATTHGFIWILGLGTLAFASTRIEKSYALVHEKNNQLKDEIQEREIAQEQLQEQTVILEEEIAEHLQTQERLLAHTDLLESEIVARNHAEEALNGLNTFNTQILNCSLVGIVVYDKDLKYRLWNNYMERMTGLPAENVIGKHPDEIFPFLKTEGLLMHLNRALKGEHIGQIEFPFSILQTGKSGYATDQSEALRNEYGDIIGVVGMIGDITSQKALENQLHQSQKMEAIGQLAGGIAHDFNNILTVIMGYSNLLSMDKNMSQAQQEAVNHISESSERAAQLTKGLLAFSRKQVINPSFVNLNNLVHHVQKFLLRIIGEDIQLNLKINTGKLTVKVDSGQIEQVLINLATNARDAMPKGGLLSIEIDSKQIDEAFDGCTPGNYACVSVSDNGSGMDDETIARMFEPFYTTKETGKGTGLGMSIVFGIIRQHQGFIKCYSELGYGTTFRVYIPLAEYEQSDVTTSPKALLPKGGTETILLAEDDPGVRKLTVSLLTQFGYDVIEAVDGDDVVEKYSANQDKVHLILSDVIMPKKNGKEAMDEISRINAHVKVLFSSGYTAEFMEGRGISGADVDFISKPVQPMELLQKIREVLDR
jgi:PAS domain S-box-containing protein